MSETNKNPLSEEKKNSDFINIDEFGKVEIQDEEVAQISDELNPEELEDIAGGLGSGGNNCACALE